jgi:TolB protein
MKKLYLLAPLIFGLLAAAAEAKVYIDIDAPAGRRLPIAIQEFVDLGTKPWEADKFKTAREIFAEAFNEALNFTAIFDIIEKDTFLEEPSEGGLSPKSDNFRVWRIVGAEILIKGGIKVDKEKLTVEAHMFDTVREERLMAKRYIGRAANPRAVSHRFADDVIEKLTGTRGIFSTKLLYVSEQNGTKEIYMCDYNGRHPQRVTFNGSINLSPQWSPDGRKLLYTSYMKGGPKLYIQELKTGRLRAASARPGINVGGRWSPDGKSVALTLSVDRSPELYILDLDSKQYTRITNNRGIDISPAWSPDASKLVYVSDIAGNPHIYMINSLGGKPARLTFQGTYHSTPSWSPDGKKIAFVRLLNGKFNIWVMNADGTDKAQLTYEGNNKTPSWSPDGRYIVFNSSRREGSYKSQIYIMRADGGGLKRITKGPGSARSPNWSPYFPK